MPRENDLRENLFNIEPVDPERQQRFREELAQIVEPQLSRGYRLYYIMGLIGAVAGIPGAVCGAAFDAENRWIWTLSLLAWIAFAGWIVFILRHGSEPMRIMQGMSKAFSGIALVIAVALVVYGLQNPSLTSVLWALLGVLAVLMTSFINLWNRVITAERTMREHLLRVEYRLANLDRSPQ
jgi:hypothetical protein